MRVVGVLDLLGDRAVHARGGQRALYEPVLMVAGEPIQPGYAPDLARAYVDRLGLDEIYVADLTAIAASVDRAHHPSRAHAEPPRHASTLDGITACGAVVRTGEPRSLVRLRSLAHTIEAITATSREQISDVVQT